MRRRKRACMKKHRELIRESRFEEARLLLWFLRHGKVLLGLDDVSFAVGNFLEEIRCYTWVNPRNGSMRVRI